MPQLLTYITDDNIHQFVNYYLTNKNKLPSNLKNKPIGDWDVSRVTNMSSLFEDAPFNEDISKWDVSNVVNMAKMFRESSFNSSVENWNVSKVENMRGMFEYAYEFNQPLNGWGEKTRNVKDMTGMFFDSPRFNQPLNNWDISNVLSMAYMFKGAKSFNQDLTSWVIADDVNIENMFRDAVNFDMNNEPTREVVERTPTVKEINGYDIFRQIATTKLAKSNKTILPTDTIYDLINMEDISAFDYLKENTDNMIFKYGTKCYSIYKGDIVKVIKDPSNIFYGCKQEDTPELPKLRDITFTEPCFRLNSIGISIGGLILLSELKSALLKKDYKTFEIVEEPIEHYIATASLNSIELDDSDDGQRNRFSNSTHCDPGSGENVYKIKFIAQRISGGGYRKKIRTKRNKSTQRKQKKHRKTIKNKNKK